MTREQALNFLLNNPVKYAHMLGFTKLTDVHNDWIIDMVRNQDDKTLQASRNTYKTTCVSVALALIIILLPKMRILFLRKTNTDVEEIISQTQKILKDAHTLYFVQCIYGINLKLTTETSTEISTNLSSDIKGSHQLVGFGIGASLTGKHFDRIFTDDIVNIQDRTSKAERERTKIIYQELQNVKNRNGRIFNTGTPWHPDDAFTLMPSPERYDCYDERIKGIFTAEEIQYRKEHMSPSLFAANYELRFIASENVIFDNPQKGADKALVEQGMMHLDSAFYGEDFTAWCAVNRHDEKWYVLGKMKRKHVEECYDDIAQMYEDIKASKLYTEDNADKGFVAKELRKKKLKVISYHENTNKYHKIVTFLKHAWCDIVFVEGTDDAFIQQILDYNEDADHDDAPDTLSSLIRVMSKKGDKEYTPLWN